MITTDRYVNVGFHTKPETKAAMRNLANAEGLSLSMLLDRLCENHVREHAEKAAVVVKK